MTLSPSPQDQVVGLWKNSQLDGHPLRQRTSFDWGTFRMLIIIWDIPIAFVPFGWETRCVSVSCEQTVVFFLLCILFYDWIGSCFFIVWWMYMYNTEYVPVTIRSVWHSTFCCKDVMIVTFNLVHYWLLTSNYGWHHFGILLMRSFRDFDLVVIHGQFYLPSPPKKV